MNPCGIINNGLINKGLSFSGEERRSMGLSGFLPAAVLSQSLEAQRVMNQLRLLTNPLQKYILLQTLQQTNEHLYFRVLIDNIAEVMPLVYTPTVGEACVKYSDIWTKPRGLFLSQHDSGNIQSILERWPHKNVKAIVFTDGERILGLGDLGANGMGIPVGKLALYVACAGVPPEQCLPVTLDVGTANATNLANPLYIGLKQPRISAGALDALVGEFMTAAKTVFGEDVLLQFEDFGNSNAFRLLETFRDQCNTFNDDIQGTASVTLAGVLASLPLTERHTLGEHTFLFSGAGEAGCGIAALIASAIVDETGCTIEEARKRIYLTDSKGLVTASRSASLAHHKLPFAHDAPTEASLLESVRRLRPSVLIGVSAQPSTFTPEIIREMANFNTRPVIFALSNPTSKSECTAVEAYTHSDGRAVFASGSPFDPVTMTFNGVEQTLVSGQGNNAYIFPGVALGVIGCGCRRISDRMFIVAAQSLASQVTEADRASGCVYPPLRSIREVSAVIAVAVADHAYEMGVASLSPRPTDMFAHMRSLQYDPSVAAAATAVAARSSL